MVRGRDVGHGLLTGKHVFNGKKSGRLISRRYKMSGYWEEWDPEMGKIPILLEWQGGGKDGCQCREQPGLCRSAGQ